MLSTMYSIYHKRFHYFPLAILVPEKIKCGGNILISIVMDVSAAGRTFEVVNECIVLCFIDNKFITIIYIIKKCVGLYN